MQAAISRYLSQIKHCYQKELPGDPGLAGKVRVYFLIGGDGKVRSTSIVESTIEHAEVEACVQTVIRRIKFPKPKGGGQVHVKYPFVFTVAE